MFLNMFFTLMLYIITFAHLRRKTIAINTFLIQKLLDFRIFLLHSLLILKIIIFLKRLIFYMSFRAFSVLTMFKSHVNAFIFVAFIFCTFFVSFSFLIYVIIFIFLINRCFENACLTFILIVICATNNKLYTMLAYMFASCVFFLTLFTFSS